MSKPSAARRDSIRNNYAACGSREAEMLFAHCALAPLALTFRITRLYEVRNGEPLAGSERITWAPPVVHGLFAGAQFGRHAAVAVTMARAMSPCEIVTAAMFCPGTNPASA